MQKPRVMRQELLTAVQRRNVTIGLAWRVLEDLMPPGWDLTQLLRHGVGEGRTYTVTCEAVTFGAKGRARKAGIPALGPKAKIRYTLQSQGETVSDAILTLALKLDDLPDALWTLPDHAGAA